MKHAEVCISEVMTEPEDKRMRKLGAVISLDERRLLLRHREGDQDAFRELVELYRSPIYGYLVRCGISRAECDDLFQESFSKIHRASASYDPERPLTPWIFTIVANTVRSHFRKSRVESALEGSELPKDTSTRSESHEFAEARETVQWLEAQLAKLPLGQREVVILCCIENMDQKEVAEALEMPLSTVKTNLRRARLALAEALVRRKKLLGREVQ